MVFMRGGVGLYIMLISQPIFMVYFGRLEDKKIPELIFVIEFIMAANQPCDTNQQVI